MTDTSRINRYMLSHGINIQTLWTLADTNWFSEFAYEGAVSVSVEVRHNTHSSDSLLPLLYALLASESTWTNLRIRLLRMAAVMRQCRQLCNQN